MPFASDFEWIKNFDYNLAPLNQYLFHGMAVLSFIFAIGIFRKICAALLLIGFYLLMTRLQLIYYGINIDFLSMLLFTTLFIPDEKKINESDWFMPTYIYYTIYSVFAFGIFLSGVNKVLVSSEWRDGLAIYEFFAISPIYKSEYLSYLIKEYVVLFKVLTYFVLVFEIIYPLLIINKKTRFLTNIGTLIFFLSVLFLTRMSDIAIANLLILIFLYQKKNWIPNG